MVALLPAVEQPLALMAEWINTSFQQVQHKSIVVQPPAEKEDGDMLSFKTRPRLTSLTRTASPSPTSSSFHLSAGDTKGSSALSTSSSEEGLAAPKAIAASRALGSDNDLQVPTAKVRRGSSGKGPAFVDAASILQRRREEAVFGLQTPQKSPTAEDKDEIGSSMANVLKEYAS